MGGADPSAAAAAPSPAVVRAGRDGLPGGRRGAVSARRPRWIRRQRGGPGDAGAAGAWHVPDRTAAAEPPADLAAAAGRAVRGGGAAGRLGAGAVVRQYRVRLLGRRRR